MESQSSTNASSDESDPDIGPKPSAEKPALPQTPTNPTFAFPDFSPSEGTSGTAQQQQQAAAAAKEKGRVRFNSNAGTTQRPGSAAAPQSPAHRLDDHMRLASPPRRPAILRGNSANSILSNASSTNGDIDDGPESATAKRAAAAAQARAQQVAAKVKADEPPSPTMSMQSLPRPASALIESAGGSTMSSASGGAKALGLSSHDIPLIDLGPSVSSQAKPWPTNDSPQQELVLDQEAQRLVRAHTWRRQNDVRLQQPGSADECAIEGDEEADNKPSEMYEGTYDGVYNVPAPTEYRGSVLSQLLKLYKPQQQQQEYHNRTMSSSSLGGASSTSGATTPSNRRKWYEQNRSQDTLANLIEASARLANPNAQRSGSDEEVAAAATNKKKTPFGRPKAKRTASQSRLSALWQEDEARITVHIAGTLARQEFIIKLCRALMLYGAPTHRLEEYLSMTARVLEIDGQFLYLPGCMVISFDDRTTHTTEMRIVRLAQGIDLGKLKDVHRVYKEVMHDVMGVEEATKDLDLLMARKDKFHPWLRVVTFGLTSVAAAPFSFSARLIDLPLCFCFGCLVGILQLIVAARSSLYSNVFEVSATVIISFLARAFGSIMGGDLFCYSALVQGGIVMLLPGYMVLSSSLELQSRAIVPGSIRIVYAIIYSLLLGFGITVGAALYGVFDDNATSETRCRDPMPSLYGFIFVPLFVVCISILYQAKWRQMPVMVLIAFAGYVVNYFSGKRFTASPQIASTLGALAVGILANLYSRIRHGVAAAILIPAVFTQVPGGLASTGGLLSGLRTANLINNSTQSVNGTDSVRFEDTASVNNVVFEVAASMVQIAIGIAVGLFLSALFVYPFGKRRSGLFSL